MISFKKACETSNKEFEALRSYVADVALFDIATAWMEKKNFRCCLKQGKTVNNDGFHSQFVAYDWAEHYNENPHHVFYDFFRGPLMNKYSRLLRGVDKA